MIDALQAPGLPPARLSTPRHAGRTRDYAAPLRLALTFLFFAALAAPAGAAVGTVDVDDQGRGAYVSDATALVTVDADARSGQPVDFGARIALASPNHWSAAIGANGAGAIAWTGQKQLRVRTRTESGEWDERAQTLARGVEGGRPAVTVSKLGRKLLAFPRGGGIVTATAGPGEPFTKLTPLAGSSGCDGVRLAGAGAGRALAVLRCGDKTRLAALAATPSRRFGGVPSLG